MTCTCPFETLVTRNTLSNPYIAKETWRDSLLIHCTALNIDFASAVQEQ